MATKKHLFSCVLIAAIAQTTTVGAQTALFDPTKGILMYCSLLGTLTKTSALLRDGGETEEAALDYLLKSQLIQNVLFLVEDAPTVVAAAYELPERSPDEIAAFVKNDLCINQVMR